ASRRPRSPRAHRACQMPIRHPRNYPAVLLVGQVTSQRPDQEVPLRNLIDKALNRGYVLLPLAAPHHRRDGRVYGKPSDKGKESRPSPGGGRGNHRMTYEGWRGSPPSQRVVSWRSARPVSAIGVIETSRGCRKNPARRHLVGDAVTYRA